MELWEAKEQYYLLYCEGDDNIFCVSDYNNDLIVVAYDPDSASNKLPHEFEGYKVLFWKV